MSLYPHILAERLEKIIGALGFWHFPHMSCFVRERGDVVDVIGWRHSEHDSTHYALYFGIWTPEFEDGLSRKEADLTTDIRQIAHMHDLSLACSALPTYWWTEREEGDFQQYSTIEWVIREVALPYFDSFPSFGDVAEMIFYDPRYHLSPLEGRLMNHPASSLFNYDIEQATNIVDTALKPLIRLDPAFQFSGGYYWRQRGEVFDIIVPRYFADWRFVKIQAMIWHPFLDGLEHTPEILPNGFTQAIWSRFTSDGKDASYRPPAFLGESKHPHTTLDAEIEGLRSYSLAWLENIKTKADALTYIRPEYRKFYLD